MIFSMKYIRKMGTIFITLFATFCMFSSEFLNDFKEDTFIRKVLEYTAAVENKYFDYRIRGEVDPNYQSKNVALVKIDDYSLSKLGVFPLPRTVWADLLNKLSTFGAKVVAFDVMYPEKSPQSHNDEVFSRALVNFQKNGGKAFIGYTVHPSNQISEDEALPEATIELMVDMVNTQTMAQLRPFAISAHTYPIEELTNSEVGLAFISMDADPDGVYRQYQTIANIDGVYLGSLGYNAYEAWSDKKSLVKVYEEDNQARAVIDLAENKKIFLDESGRTPIRYRGLEAQFPNYSLYDVIIASDTDEKMKKNLEGRIIFIGSTAAGAHDLRPTPMDAKTPGVYAHINFSQMLIDQYLYRPGNESLKYSLIIMLLGICLFMIVHRFDQAFVDLLTIVFIIVGPYYLDREYFLPEGYQLKLFYCYFCFFSLYLWSTFLNFYEANKEKRQIRGTFSRYVAPTVVDEMLKDPENIQVGGSKMDITCLFSDVRDFTSISEGLSAQDLANMLNQYMNGMTDIVFETKGTLDKYIGDAIVAIWGAPLPIGNHAQYAVEAAIRMTEAMPAINDDFKKRNLPHFSVGIGLNSGECSVGNMGSSRIFSYTALGDNMNLGARLEGLCKYYGTQILISDSTLSRIDQKTIKTRPIDKVIVKGRTQPVAIHEVISKAHFMSSDTEAFENYLKAFEMYSKKDFKEASELLQKVLEKYPSDKSTLRVSKLCEKYASHSEEISEDFDVTKMTEK